MRTNLEELAFARHIERQHLDNALIGELVDAVDLVFTCALACSSLRLGVVY